MIVPALPLQECARPPPAETLRAGEMTRPALLVYDAHSDQIQRLVPRKEEAMKDLLVLLLALFLIATPALAQKIHIDYDEEADFSKYKTFAWYSSPDTSVADSNDLVHRRIVEIIQNQLQSGSLELVGSDPDLYVTYHTDEKEEMSLNTTHYGYGYPSAWAWDPYYGGWGGGMSSSHTTAYTYTRGTLIIDIWDAKEEKLIWRGSATDVVPENPQKLERKLEKSLQKMAKKWDKMYKGA
jgi:hypothetical protein